MTSSAVLWHAFTAAFLSVTQVVLICGLGFFSRKYKLVSNDDLFAGYEFWKTLAKVLVIMINPCFVVATFVNYIDRDQLGEIYLVALLVSVFTLYWQRDWVEGEGLNTAIGMLSNAVVIFAIWTFGVTMLASLAEDGAVVEKERRESRRMEMGVGGAVENKTEEELPCPLSPPGVLSRRAQHDGGDDDEGRRTRPGPAVISALAALSSSILGNGFVQAFVNHPCVNAFTIAQTLAIVLSLLHPLREAYLDSIVFEAQFMVGQALVPMTLVVLGATLSGRRIFGSRDDQIPKKKKADHEPVPTSCRSGGGAQAQAEEEVAASSVPRDEFDLTVTGAFVIVLLRVLVANVCSVPLIYFLWKNEIRPFGEDSPRIVQSRNMALYFFILCASPPASNINLVCVTQDVMVRPMAKVFTLSQFTSIVTITLSVTVAVALLDDA
eukprot:g3589.t1